MKVLARGMVDFGSLPKNSLPPITFPWNNLTVSIFFVSIKNLKILKISIWVNLFKLKNIPQ